MSRGDPAGASRGPTARGKRVPEAEINIKNRTSNKKTADKRDFHRVAYSMGASA
ncbi:hypothetical protein [Peribacillus frigoritolerans]|uniref:Uncharacterized protein n=1 Tax=Peribacillus frigoritolerans TaxID=450367 RepID=A0AAJ1QJE9_9BACI|nr:hypothetical protein [Peribacillus frigoritolerans]MDM5282594.1 hypothetical protein [Peribacillus frigoritolerans]